MTKRELLAFLEPFDDDIYIKIRVRFLSHDETKLIVNKHYFIDRNGNGVVDLEIDGWRR